MRSWLFAVAGLVACKAPAAVPDGGAAPDAASPARVAITATVTRTRVQTREHMIAAVEMQLSGEPLATAMGRDLAAYSRAQVPPDLYNDPVLAALWIDLPGFSTAVESYEYSKQPMNNLAFESGAGTALDRAPLVAGDLAARLQHYAAGSHALGRWVVPGEPLGWPGLRPTLHVFASFDPAIDPTSAFDRLCTITSDDDLGEGGGPLICADYECDATTLHLRDRAAQIDPTITPGADGFSGWKYGLWILNYLQIMHDATERAVVTVAPADEASVGVPDNGIVGRDATGAATSAGTYLGSSSVEGFQAQLLVLEMDARADDWLLHLTTTDGATLSGFPSLAAALAYGYQSPLRWFPGAIAVTEAADGTPAYAIRAPTGAALDLIGLALGYAEVYALTDAANRDVGAAPAARTFFDGDPFAADDQRPDGEPTLHDRALAMMRVALVDLDRLHGDPASGLIVDAAGGHTLSMTSVAYLAIGLRTVLRALGSQLELYSNNTPDTAVGMTPLDALPIGLPGQTFSGRLRQLLDVHGALLLDHLTDATGRAWSGWDVAAGATTDDADTLDAHTAAVRGLFALYLATGDVRYRARAIAVFDRLDRVFYDAAARIYAATPAPVDAVEFTPLRFALLQSALRDMYELVATRPGEAAREPVLEERIARLNKLVLNGWDDRDRDQIVSTDECVVAPYPGGGLQVAERTLTGESGRGVKQGPQGLASSDRDHDCVPEIDDAHLAAGLAASITFHLARQ